MHPRAAELISILGLHPHPEGGYFREIHRSPLPVHPDDGRDVRAALTVIYFLLVQGDVSRWHRVASDESWHFHEGDPVELLIADPHFASVATCGIGPRTGTTEPVCVVPAGRWQSARTTGAYALVSCSVGPGFVFGDFEMLRDLPDEAAALEANHPAWASLV
jgi:hypothetical protein